MNASPNQLKIGGLIVTAILALAVGYFMVVSPKKKEAGTLHAQIDDTRAQIAAAQGTDGAGQPTVNPIRVADLFTLSRAMPDKTDIPNVLLQLSQISTETGVQFESITPHDPVALGSYEQIGIDLVFEGKFYDLSDFLYRLRNLVGVHQGVLDSTGRLFSVDAISFDEGELQFPDVKATLTVSAYVYGDGIPDPIPAGATGSEAAPATPSASPTDGAVLPSSTTPTPVAGDGGATP